MSDITTDIRSDLRRYERRLAGNLLAFQQSPVHDYASGNTLPDLFEFAAAMARRGLRFSHQGAWCLGHLGSLDGMDPAKVERHKACDFRFVLLPDGRPEPLYAGAVVGCIKVEPADPRFEVIWLNQPIGLLIHWREELPAAQEMPAGVEAIEERLREAFLAGRPIVYREPTEGQS